MRSVNTFIGSPVERVEDLRFLRGRGQYMSTISTAKANGTPRAPSTVHDSNILA